MERPLLDLAESQLGLLSRCQLVEHNVDRSVIARRLSSGEWTVLFPSVYRLRGVPSSLTQRMLAGLLWAGEGSVISHSTAGIIWGFESMPTDPIHVITTHRRKPPRGLKLHHSVLEPGDVVVTGNVRATSAARTLLDLGAVVPRKTVEGALDLAVQRRLLEIPALLRRLEMSRPGQRGPKTLRSIFDQGDGAPRSALERRFLRLLKQRGLPSPIPQFPIDLGPYTAHVDFAYLEHKVAIECQGFRYHGGQAAWARDADRHARLTTLGWRVLQITWTDVSDCPDLIVERVAALIAPPVPQLA